MKELGFWRAFADTWSGASLRPTAFFSALAPFGLGPAFLYALLVGAVGNVGSALWGASVVEALGGDAYGVPIGVELISTVMGQAVGIWLIAGIVHVGCLLFGCASQGFGATFRVLAYASGPALLGILPGGSFVAGIWSAILAIIGIQWVQRTTRLRAALSVLLLPGLFFGGILLLMLLLLFVGVWLPFAGGPWA